MICSERSWTGEKNVVGEMFLLKGCRRALVLDEDVVLVKANCKGNLPLLLLPCKLSGGFVRRN